MSERVLRIPCAGETLIGILHPAADTSAARRRRAVLILVGGPQYRVGSHRQFLLAARHLAARGHPVLRADFRGMGDSTGTAVGFEQVRDEVRACLDALDRELPAPHSICVFGLCDAASAALLHATDDARVESLVLANPWVRTEAGQAAALVKHYYANRLLQKEFWLKMVKGGLNPSVALRGLLQSVRASRRPAEAPRHFVAGMLAGLCRFKGRVLLLSSGRDLTAREFDDLCAADEGWRRALADARIRRIDLPATDHTFSDRAGLNAANTAISDFLDADPEQN